jgi:hypothetical protein
MMVRVRVENEACARGSAKPPAGPDRAVDIRRYYLGGAILHGRRPEFEFIFDSSHWYLYPQNRSSRHVSAAAGPAMTRMSR